MIQVIPEQRNVRIRCNDLPHYDELVLGYVIYTGKHLEESPYEPDDDIYVRVITTNDLMENVQAGFGGDAQIVVDGEVRDIGFAV